MSSFDGALLSWPTKVQKTYFVGRSQYETCHSRNSYPAHFGSPILSQPRDLTPRRCPGPGGETWQLGEAEVEVRGKALSLKPTTG